MRKLERETKRLFQILQKASPGVKWHANRGDGAISKGWTPFVKIEVHPGETPSQLFWNPQALAAKKTLQNLPHPGS